ncbi:MAG TPA: response regulator transcription factor [Terracidiphilus sp.]|jgi:hypothetical protein
MRLAINSLQKQSNGAGDLKTDGPFAYTTALLEGARKAIQLDPARRNFDGFHIVMVPFQPAEPTTLTTKNRSTGSEPLFIFPMHWRDVPASRTTDDRVRSVADEFSVVCFGEVRIHFDRQEATRSGMPVTLTAMEFKTVAFLTQNPHRVISRDELLDKVWGYDNYPCTRTVDNRILRLRQKLESDAANPKHFLTVYGSGYKFVP